MLSFLWIGFIPRFQEHIASIIAIGAALLLPDEWKTVILLFLIVLFITYYAFAYNANVDKDKNDKFVFRRALGLWIASLSPFVLFTLFWAIVCLTIYYLYLPIIGNFKLFNQQCKEPKCEFLKRDFIAGILTLVTLQIVYSGAALLPWIYMFFNK